MCVRSSKVTLLFWWSVFPWTFRCERNLFPGLILLPLTDTLGTFFVRLPKVPSEVLTLGDE